MDEWLDEAPRTGWSAPHSWPTRLFSGDPLIILIALVVTLSFPVLLHLFLYRESRRLPSQPTFLLLGPVSSGKTSLGTLLQRQTLSDETELNPSTTHTSQTSQSYSLTLPSSIPLGRNRYRSDNDTSVVASKSTTTPYILLDTPGHGKLRSSVAISQTNISSLGLSGIIFVVDASALDSSAYLSDAASYLHDILLALLRRRRSKALPKLAREKSIPVLIAANKQDLFTALPPGSVRERLEQEIERLRDSKRRGLSGVDEKDGGSLGAEEDDFEMLGSGGDQKFSFAALGDEDNEPDLKVEVLGGSVRGEEAGKGVWRWQEWIGQCL